MKLFGWLRRRSSLPPDQKVLMTVVQDDDPDRPTQCECGQPATVWVDYLWREIDHKRNEFLTGHTTEDVCEKDLHRLLVDGNVAMQDWGIL